MIYGCPLQPRLKWNLIIIIRYLLDEFDVPVDQQIVRFMSDASGNVMLLAGTQDGEYNGGTNKQEENTNDTARNQAMGIRGRNTRRSQPDEYGKSAVPRYEPGTDKRSEIIKAYDAYVREGEQSIEFKRWSRGRKVTTIEELYKMKDPSVLNGVPSVFKVHSAQVRGLDHWDMDVALGYKGDAVSSGANKSGAFWGVSSNDALGHQWQHGNDENDISFLKIGQYYIRAENPVYYNTGGSIGDIHPQQILRKLRRDGHDVAIVDGLMAHRVVLHLDGHHNPAVKFVDNIGTFSDNNSDWSFSLLQQSSLTSSITDAKAELKRLGLDDAAVLQFVDSIANGKAEGSQLGDVIKIVMSAQDPVGILHHEVIHLLREKGLISDKEYNALRLASAQWLYNHPQRAELEARYKEYASQGRTAEQVAEEKIADMFRHYAASQRTNPPGLVKRVMDRIRQFMRALSNAFKGNGFTDAEAVMEAIYSGSKGMP